jgi:hypothetical protein
MEQAKSKPLGIKPTTYLSKLSDLANHPEINFIVMMDNSMRYDDGYGSDRNTSYSTLVYMSIIGLEDENSVREWIRTNMDARFAPVKEYKIFKISPVQIMTEVSINVSLT